MSPATQPLAYFITFHTKGSWLHGEAKGSGDRDHRGYGEAFVPADPQRVDEMRQRLEHPPLVLDAAQRRVIHETVERVCEHRGWLLHALHVRTTHVHAIVTAAAEPEKVMNDLKSWCTRRLREAGLLPPERKPWSEHGSTRYLWNEAALVEKVNYVLNGQGVPLD